MSNPVLTRTFEKTPAGYPVHPGYQPGQAATNGPATTAPVPVAQPVQVNQPQAGGPGVGSAYTPAGQLPADTRPMTVDDVVVKTGLLLGLVVLTAIAAAMISASNPAISQSLWIIGLIGGLVLGLVNSFRRQPSVPLIMGYALFEGAFLGAMSYWANTLVPGVVGQAVIATFVVAAVSLAAYKTGVVKVNAKFMSILKVALISYLAFAVINLVAMMFLPMGLFGIRSMGNGVWLGIGLIAVVIAAMTLIADFATIDNGVRNGAPAQFAWTAAFGITVTLIWMYIEILRLLLILYSSRD